MAKSKRNKQNRISLPGGETATAPRQPGQGSRTDLNQKEDPRSVVLSVRERHTGLIGKDALAPDQVDDMGRCIVSVCNGDDRSNIINTWRGLIGSRANYLSRYVGQTGNPKCSSFEMIPDRTETDPSLRVDLRTCEERDAQAVLSWNAWLGHIKALPLWHRWAIRNALGLSLGAVCLWCDQKPTSQGVASVEALRALTDRGNL